MTGMGFKRDPNAPRHKMKAVSSKQRRRDNRLDEFKMEACAEMVAREGTAYCMAGMKKWPHKCEGVLVVDHIKTRNQFNADRPTNLQIICWAANSLKGSLRNEELDFRPE